MIPTRVGFSVLALALALGIGAMSGNLSSLQKETGIGLLSSPSFQQVAINPCTPEPLSRTEAVRGLALSIPQLPVDADRIDFDGSGNVVTYEVSSSAQEIADFYLSELPSKRCLQNVGEENGLVFQLANSQYAVRVAPVDVLSGASVRYELGYLGSAVLGESVYLAQTDPGSYTPPPTTTYTPPPSELAPVPTTAYTPPPTYTQPSSTTFVPLTSTHEPYSGTYPAGTTYPTGTYPAPDGSMPYLGNTNQPYPQPGPYPTNTNYPAPYPYPTNTNQPYPGQYPTNANYPAPYPYPGGTNQPNQAPYGSQNQNQWNQQQPYPGMNQGFPGQPASTQRGEQGMMGDKFGGMNQRGMMGEQGQFGQQGQFGPPRPGEAGQQGEGMQAEMEKQMQERMLGEMKSHMGDFLKQIGFMTKQIPMMRKRMKVCNADFPAELNNALEAIPKLVEDVKNATDPEKAMTAMEAVQDAAMVFEELGPQMGDLMGFCTKIKQAEREVNRVAKEVARLEARAKARKVDPELLGELKSIVTEMKGSLAKAKSLAKTSVDEADTLVEGIFENMDNLREATATINMALDLPKGLKEADATVRTITTKIKALERKKDPVVDELKPLLETLKSQIVEIREIAKVKPIDPALLGDALQVAFETREQIFDILQDHGAESTFIPKFQQGQNFQFDFHDSFMQQKPESVSGAGEGFGPSFGGSQFPGTVPSAQ